MHLIDRMVFKNGNGYYNYLRSPDLQDNDFECLCEAISLDKVEFLCEETVRIKLTVNYSGFITYSKIIMVYG